jgi:hypothetical protein
MALALVAIGFANRDQAGHLAPPRPGYIDQQGWNVGVGTDPHQPLLAVIHSVIREIQASHLVHLQDTVSVIE